MRRLIGTCEQNPDDNDNSSGFRTWFKIDRNIFNFFLSFFYSKLFKYNWNYQTSDLV